MSDLSPPRRPDETRGGQIAVGVALTAGLHVGVGLLLGIVTAGASLVVRDFEVVGLFWVLFIGVAQLLYMVPAWIVARRKGHLGIALGLLIGAALTFLANSACFGALFFGGFPIH